MESDIIISEIRIQNVQGLHARPASLFVQTASSFQSDIIIEKDGEVLNGKSLMNLLMLCAGFGTVLKITARGPDCQAALNAIKELVDGKFGED